VSTVIQIGPVVVVEWATIVGDIVAALDRLGFETVDDDVDASAVNRAEIEIENSEILPSAAGTQEKLVVDRDGVRATFSRDARGALKLCLEGAHLSKAQLHALGEELMGRVTQQYAYHRIMSELKERNMTVVDEELSADQSVKIRVRNF
jgi:Protein of unknown function (DUF1257)